jgi:glucose-1-phosphate thymidylyltransferase
VATINQKKKIINIVEKPKKTKSNLAVTGLYFFDSKVVSMSKNLKPSKRKEIEIVDLLNKYKNKKQLSAEIIGRGGAWLDTGSIKDFNNTSNFVATIENRQGFKIGCIEEVALNNKWIGKNQIKKAVNFYGNCEYSRYLENIKR